MTKENELYPKLFTWLFIGLLVSFATGYVLSMNEVLAAKILSFGLFPIVIIEILIAFMMGSKLTKMSDLTMKVCFMIYSFTTGITFASIFIIYELTSLITIFLATALIFGVLALYGYKTKKDISKIGPILFTGLVATLIISLLNIFLFHSSVLEIIITAVGIIVFCGYIIYDMKLVKKVLEVAGEEKAAVYGAFCLYLDFINLFIRIVDLFGDSKN